MINDDHPVFSPAKETPSLRYELEMKHRNRRNDSRRHRAVALAATRLGAGRYGETPASKEVDR
jgi:hypothetical protein